VLTKQLACGNVPENDSASPPAFRGHADHTRNNEMDVSIRPAASDYILVALVAGPFAPIGDGAQGLPAQILEYVDFLESEHRRRSDGGSMRRISMPARGSHLRSLSRAAGCDEFSAANCAVL
jgi:hypothetical protein